MIPPEHHAKLKVYRETLPVDVQGVVGAFGLKVYATELPEGVSGVLYKPQGSSAGAGFVILVDKTEPPERQRFTAAHELGHYLLHRDSVGDRIAENFFLHAEGMTSTQEDEANEFANELLMPMDAVLGAIQDRINTVEGLAQHFGVSVVAMGNRLGVPA